MICSWILGSSWDPVWTKFCDFSDLLALNCSIGSRVVLFVIRGWKSHPHPVPGCAENIVNTVVFIRFHVFSCSVNLGVFRVTFRLILGDF